MVWKRVFTRPFSEGWFSSSSSIFPVSNLFARRTRRYRLCRPWRGQGFYWGLLTTNMSRLRRSMCAPFAIFARNLSFPLPGVYFQNLPIKSTFSSRSGLRFSLHSLYTQKCVRGRAVLRASGAATAAQTSSERTLRQNGQNFQNGTDSTSRPSRPLCENLPVSTPWDCFLTICQ